MSNISASHWLMFLLRFALLGLLGFGAYHVAVHGVAASSKYPVGVGIAAGLVLIGLSFQAAMKRRFPGKYSASEETGSFNFWSLVAFCGILGAMALFIDAVELIQT